MAVVALATTDEATVVMVGGTTDEGREAEAVRPTTGRTFSVLLAMVVAAGAPGVGSGAPAIEIEVSRGGFAPSTLTLRQGEAVRIVLSAVDGEHCFAVDALRIEKRVVPGRSTSFDLTPDRPGVFPFYCCLEKGRAAEVERGQLQVRE